LPVPAFAQPLPVSERRAEIGRAIRDHQVVVICGETGSGKTTQIPQICLSLGLGAAGMIGHTQPRRIAARSVAARIAEELGGETGGRVGYKVRFSDRVGPDTVIKLMTDGILLAETQGDPELLQYEVIIIDEAHERSLNIDFLLGYLRRLLPRRPDLKVIVTSATIDPERFARHFADAPILQVSGRMYPVEVRYRPLAAGDEDALDRDLQQAILDAVDEVSRIGPGDMLIFLTGEREIRETAESLRKHHPPGTEILPLYARLSAAEQNRVFQPHGRRRIVLATNVAETSLTVPGIRYVIDPGLARISRYSHRAKVQRLPIEKISQASANQRAGRCGRTAAGVCIRLYSEEDFQGRAEFTDPEILRTNLAAVILQMCALGLGAVEDFPFVDPPDSRLISDGFGLLFELRAVDDERRITGLGRQLARLPIDPRLGRMILAARDEGCLHEALLIACHLAIQDPRERPLERQQAADGKHRRFHDERSDFVALVRLWDYYHQEARQRSRNQLRQLCREDFLSYVRMREWQDLYRQIKELVTEMGLRLNDQPADYAPLHRALLSGLLGHVGLRQEEDQSYLGARGRKFYLFPGSGLFRKGPQWLMAAELVETTRLYARTNGKILPDWIEDLARHLVKRSYSDPHWEKRPAQVAAKERVTLYGLPIVVDRRVNYGPVNPAEAREIFIRRALVEGDFHCSAAFFRHNRALLEEIGELEAKGRRRDVLVDEETLYSFYDQRIPAGIYSGPAFDRWRKKAEREDPRRLFFDREYLMAHPAAQITGERFPDLLDLDGVRLPLSYRFEPGEADDGVTVTVPLAALNQLDPQRLEWLVPGLLAERMAALLRSLPKALRRHFVPVPDYVAVLMQTLTFGDGSLTAAMAERLHKVTGVAIPPDAWKPEAVPAHLQMNVRVVDPDGRVLAEGRGLEAIQERLRGQARESFAALPTPEYERDGITDWDFGDLPEQVEFVRNGVALKGYPALVDQKDTVALRLLDSPQQAAAAHRAGLRRLYALQLRNELKYLRRNLPRFQAMSLHYLGVGGQDELREDLVSAVIDRAFLGDGPLPRGRDAFLARLEQGRGQLPAVANDLCALAAEALDAWHQVRKRLAGDPPLSWQEAAVDIRGQLERLVYPGFVTATPYEWLRHLPRYLKAIDLRLTKLTQAPDRDRQRRADVERLWSRYLAQARRNAERGVHDPELERYRWLLEELRVSLFAQELRTAVPVSVKRLEAQWDKVRA
ncbi:MAG: ATP-dependent RNA helicase HrpA, partial [Pseudomonadota bacterium]|nr:ATP-dependent RNA helicase HrpA [Pseudomonadota bacterium]